MDLVHNRGMKRTPARKTVNVHEAKSHGAFTAEINPDLTEASATVDIAIHAGAEVALPALDALLTEK